MNIKHALEYGINKLKENNIKEPILKSKIVLANFLNKQKEYLIIHENEELDKLVEDKYIEAIERLSKNIPIQYITNKQEFMGIDFLVNENVLIPQPDTEILVEEVIDICNNNYNSNQSKESKIKVLDLCTGSGAIGIALAKILKNFDITLSDISTEALKVAKQNIVNTGLNNLVKLIQSDLFENIDEKFDIIVSNPPYIKTEVIKTLDKEVLNEPILALDGGKDGLEIYRRIINEGYNYLNNNGYLCLEIGYDQKDEVINLIKDTKKYKNIYTKKDLARLDRIIISKKC